MQQNKSSNLYHRQVNRREFDKLLVERIPGISKGSLTIYGKINTEVKDTQLLAPEFIEGKDLADVVTTTTS